MILRHVLLLILLFLPSSIHMEPVSTGMAIAGAIVTALMYVGIDYGKCKNQECCDDNWIKLNYSGLTSTLKRSLHGQHLVERIVTKVLKGFINQKDPKKALVLAFHGSTGSGKNFVSKMIADHLYVEGIKSKYVHMYIATKHFPHKQLVEEYRAKLQRDLKEKTELCGRSLFIFDEVDKMPAGIIDILKPYMDYYNDIDGIDYRKNIFLFLSNAGSSAISKVALECWMNGKEREDIAMKDMQRVINIGAFNEEGGLKNSAIIKNSLIDFYVPFLPLEKKHVEMCIKDELRARFKPADSQMIEEIADEIEYYPSDVNLYSESGCKKISQKVDFYIED